MTGRMKHVQRSHKTHKKMDGVSKHFYHSNAVRATAADIRKRASLFEKIVGLIQKGDR